MIEQLTEKNFQEFLYENQKKIYVFETPDYEYEYYFPSCLKILKSATGIGKWARQWG